MALDRDYRPLIFDDALGQAGTVKVLRKTLEDIPNRVEPTIFHGPYGSGKTTLARIYARAILCPQRQEDGSPCNECDSCTAFFADTHPGYNEINGANITKVEDFRKILEGTGYQASGSKDRVYLIDECHMMSKSSQNLFLKPLEEGIDGVYWFFCTTEYHKIIDTIQSRCLDYGIRPIDPDEIVKRVLYVCDKEQIVYEESAVRAMVEVKAHFRDILKFVGQVREIGGVTEDNVFEYLDIGVNDTYLRILLALKDDIPTAMNELRKATVSVSAQDAYNGLITASMDVYKAHIGVRCSHVVRDPELRKQVYEVYGKQITRITRELLHRGARRIDHNYLISTLLLIQQQIGLPPEVATGATVVVREVIREVAAPSTPTSTPPATTSSPPLETAPKNGVQQKTQPLTDLDDKARKPKPSALSTKTTLPSHQSDGETDVISETEFSLLIQRGYHGR